MRRKRRIFPEVPIFSFLFFFSSTLSCPLIYWKEKLIYCLELFMHKKLSQRHYLSISKFYNLICTHAWKMQQFFYGFIDHFFPHFRFFLFESIIFVLVPTVLTMRYLPCNLRCRVDLGDKVLWCMVGSRHYRPPNGRSLPCRHIQLCFQALGL